MCLIVSTIIVFPFINWKELLAISNYLQKVEVLKHFVVRLMCKNNQHLVPLHLRRSLLTPTSSYCKAEMAEMDSLEEMAKMVNQELMERKERKEIVGTLVHQVLLDLVLPGQPM